MMPDLDALAAAVLERALAAIRAQADTTGRVPTAAGRGQ
jgi:hypothetical protein